MNAPYHNKALPQGTILREWRLEEVLGVGGFGIVYRGKDVYFGETVAIKEYFPGAISDRLDGTTVAPTDSSSEEVYELGRQKFLEEAKILWNLSRPERHPNVVNVRSLFEIHGTAYMVMDFESGVSLSEMLKAGRKFDEKSLLALIIPIAEGLDRAHRAGVLHRDIKPANILVDQAGRPVLIDFGSARFEAGQATNTKVTFYTPPFAAIEQYVKSYPQGPWTDIYALGVVLYQCVSGEKPPEVLERLHGGYGQALSARQWPGYSRVFTRAVDAAMAIRPLERPQSISDWLKLFDLEDLEDEATRIGAPLSTNHLPAMASQPVAAAANRAPTVSAAAQSAAPQSRKAAPLILKLVAAAALIGVVAAAFWVLRRNEATLPAAPVSGMSVAAPQQADLGQDLDRKMDALLQTASKTGRGNTEISALTGYKTKIATLAAQIQGAAADKSGKAAAATAQMNEAATEMFHSEVNSLGRSEKRLWADVSEPLDTKDSPDGAKAVAAIGQTKSDLDASFATITTGLDAGQVIDDTRQLLLDFGAFQSAYAAVLPFYASAKRSQFNDINSSVQTVSGQIATLASVSKPWILASQSRKQAYQLRQDNAAQAKALASQIDGLAATLAATKDMKQLDAAIAQATAAESALDALFAASNGANP